MIAWQVIRKGRSCKVQKYVVICEVKAKWKGGINFGKVLTVLLTNGFQLLNLNNTYLKTHRHVLK